MQLISNHKWEKLGLLLKPNKDIWWCVSHTGSPYVKKDNNQHILYFTGRDTGGKSRIGKCNLFLSDKPYISDISLEPILDLGNEGTFSQDGTSYPCVIENNLYYTGWKRTYNVPFENNLGLAISLGEKYENVTKAPLLSATNQEPFGIGSVEVIKDESYLMWYTAFIKWENGKHYYTIRHAKSKDGIKWKRIPGDCIKDTFNDEFAICRPSVIKSEGWYHMVFCSRGDRYKLGYAYSKDGINWNRNDNILDISNTPNSFDSWEMCYPHWFIEDDFVYLLYSGNDYGNEGIGIARLRLW